MVKDVEAQFDDAMMDIYRRAKSELGCNLNRFLQMLTEHRGLETAKRLLRANTVSQGFTALWERGRLDLTVEALIHDHAEYHSLFTPEEHDMARRRLEEYKYPPLIDPVEQCIGALRTSVPDWANEHDKYLGQALTEEMRGNNPGR